MFSAIKLTDQLGNPFIVEQNVIIKIAPYIVKECRAEITLVTGEKIWVEESMNEIMKKMGFKYINGEYLNESLPYET